MKKLSSLAAAIAILGASCSGGPSPSATSEIIRATPTAQVEGEPTVPVDVPDDIHRSFGEAWVERLPEILSQTSIRQASLLQDGLLTFAER